MPIPLRCGVPAGLPALAALAGGGQHQRGGEGQGRAAGGLVTIVSYDLLSRMDKQQQAAKPFHVLIMVSGRPWAWA